MNPENNTASSAKERIANSLPVMQPGERTVCTIKRHPIGIFGVYAMCGLVVIVTAVLAFLIVPGFSDDNVEQTALIGALIFVVVASLCTLFAALATKIYWGNTWVITTDSMTQVNQVGLFNRQSRQLALEDIEDVGSKQKGILAQLFNFGLLQVETASETGKFMFPYCPNPNYYAQQILNARENFVQKIHAEEQGHESGVLRPAPPVSPPVVSPAPEPPQPPQAPLQQPPPGPGNSDGQQ